MRPYMTNHLKQLTDLELHVAAFVLSQRLDETIQCAELISKELERRRNETHNIGRVIVDTHQATKREKTESQGWL